MIFSGYEEVLTQARVLLPTDYDLVLNAFENYWIDKTDRDVTGKNLSNDKSYARQIINWLEESCPRLSEMMPETVKAYLVLSKRTRLGRQHRHKPPQHLPPAHRPGHHPRHDRRQARPQGQPHAGQRGTARRGPGATHTKGGGDPPGLRSLPAPSQFAARLSTYSSPPGPLHWPAQRRDVLVALERHRLEESDYYNQGIALRRNGRGMETEGLRATAAGRQRELHQLSGLRAETPGLSRDRDPFRHARG